MCRALVLIFLCVGWDAADGVAQSVLGADLPVTGALPSELEPFDSVTRAILSMTGAPGAALAVAHGGQLVLARGYGYADLTAGETVLPSSSFRIASVSKPLTAVAVLKLVEEGRLSLDDRMLDLIDLRPPAGATLDPRMRDITVRHLLYHAAGWDRRQSGFDPMFAAARIAIALNQPPPAAAADIIRFMLGQPLDFDPGTRQEYSNLGYAILGRVIEAVTGERYEDHVRRAVLEPARAAGIRMGRSLLEHRAEGEVRYHDPRRLLSDFPGTGIVPAPYGAFTLEAMDAHGGWVASAPDLVRLLVALDLHPTPPDLLEPGTLRAMLRPHETAERDTTYYGMGWEVDPGSDPGISFHRGDLPGTTALVIRTGRTQLALLLNGNAGSRENAERMLPMLLEAVNAVAEWPPIDLFPQEE